MAYELRLYGQQPIGMASTVGVLRNAPQLVELIHVVKFEADRSVVEPYQGKLLAAPPGLYDLDLGDDWHDLIVVEADNLKQIILRGNVVYRGHILNYPRVSVDVLKAFRALNLSADKLVAVYQDEKGRQQLEVRRALDVVPMTWQHKPGWPLLGQLDLETGEIKPR